MWIINNLSYIKVKWLILEKRNEDELKYIKQNDNNRFAVISNETEALKISENNDMTVN